MPKSPWSTIFFAAGFVGVVDFVGAAAAFAGAVITARGGVFAGAAEGGCAVTFTTAGGGTAGFVVGEGANTSAAGAFGEDGAGVDTAGGVFVASTEVLTDSPLPGACGTPDCSLDVSTTICFVGAALASPMGAVHCANALLPVSYFFGGRGSGGTAGSGEVVGAGGANWSGAPPPPP